MTRGLRTSLRSACAVLGTLSVVVALAAAAPAATAATSTSAPGATSTAAECPSLTAFTPAGTLTGTVYAPRRVQALPGMIVLALPKDALLSASPTVGCAVADSQGAYSLSLPPSTAGWIVFTASVPTSMLPPGITTSLASASITFDAVPSPAVRDLELGFANYTVTPQISSGAAFTTGYGVVCLAAAGTGGVQPLRCGITAAYDGVNDPMTARLSASGVATDAVVVGFHQTADGAQYRSTVDTAVRYALPAQSITLAGGSGGGGGGPVDVCAAIDLLAGQTPSTGDLTGSVVEHSATGPGGAGPAVSGATVVAVVIGDEGPDFTKAACTTSDAQGQFTVAARGEVPEGARRIIVTSPGAGSSLGGAQMGVWPDFPLGLQLHPANSTIVPELDGTPVSGTGFAFLVSDIGSLVTADIARADAAGGGSQFQLYLAPRSTPSYDLQVVMFTAQGLLFGELKNVTRESLLGRVVVPVAGEGGGGGGGGGGGASSTNCQPGASPTISGTVRGSGGAPVSSSVVVQPVFDQGGGEGFAYLQPGTDGTYSYCFPSNSGTPTAIFVSVAPPTNSAGLLLHEDFVPELQRFDGPFCISFGCTGSFDVSSSAQAEGTVTLNGQPASARWMLMSNDRFGTRNLGLNSGTTSAGKWQVRGLQQGSYRATITPQDSSLSAVDVDFSVDETGAVSYGTRGSGDVALQTANFAGTLRRADGVTPATWSSIQITSTAPECALSTGGNTAGGGSGCTLFTNSDFTGAFRLNVPDGTYSVKAYKPWDDSTSTDTTYTMVVSGGAVTINGVAKTAPFDLVLSGPNLRLVLLDGATPVAKAWVNVVPWAPAETNPRGFADWDWSRGSGGATGVDGVVGLNVTQSGSYRIMVHSWDGSFGQVTVTASITVSGDEVTVASCSNDFNFVLGPCQTGTTPMSVDGDGRTVVTIPQANVPFRICDNNPDVCQPLANAGVEVQRSSAGPDGRSTFWQFVTWTNSTQTGKAALTLEQTGSYRVTLRPPYSTQGDYAETTFFISVTVDGGTTTVRRCTGPATDPCSTQGDPLVGSGGFLWDQRFAAPNVTGTVLDSSGAASPFTWVEFSQTCADWEGCRRWAGGASTNASGRFASSLAVGSYIATVRPNFNSAEGSAVTEVEFTVTESGLEVGGSPVDALDIQMRGANVRGVVYAPDGSLASFVGVQIEKKNGDFWSWVTWTQVGSAGTFGVSLPAGTYRARIEPNGRFSAGAAVATFVVSGVDPVLESVTSGGSLVDGRIRVQFAQPNVTGTVTTPSGVARGAYIGIEKWDARSQQFQWTNDYVGTATNWADGTFALTLPEGRWRLQVNPPWPNTESLTTTNVAILVQSDNSVCRLSDSVAGVCDPSLTGPLAISFGAPNYQATVTAGGNSVVGSWVWVDRKTDWGWGPGGMWANINDAGAFGLNFTETGVYRINVNPAFQLTGYSKGTAYVRVEDGGASLVLCSQVAADAESGALCAGASQELTGVVIELPGANLVGTVSGPSGPLRDAWVELLSETSFGPRWVEGAPTKGSGDFGLTITEPGAYTLQVNPPWNNSSGLTRSRISIVAGNFDGDGALDICRASNHNAVAGTCASVEESLTITLGTGNIGGTVTSPSGDVVPNSMVSVERWSAAEWLRDNQYAFTWTNETTNTNSQGVYGANLDPGTYRITAYPSWNNTDGSAKASKVVTVSAEGWCLQSESPADGTGAADAFGTCDGPVTSTPTLNVTLAAANVRGTITTGELALVRDAYVSLSREVQMSVDGNSWTSYQHLGGTPTNGSGEFALRIDTSGTYLLEVNPPWQGAGSDLTRFTRTLTATCVADTCTFTVAGDGSGAYGADRALSLFFPLPNASGRVCAASSGPAECTGVENAWVAVEAIDESGQTLQWVEGASTRRGGNFRLALTDGSYRITAYPSWQNPVGLPQSAVCTVTGGVLACESGTHGSGELDIKLASANVTGTLVYQVVGSGTAPMAYGYVEILASDGSWVKGAPADAEGAFALALDPGTYTLRAWPNWSTAARPMISIDLSVGQSCGAVCWKYATESTETPAPLTIDFDHVAPNVTVTIAEAPGSPVTGKRTVLVEEEVSGSFEARPALSGRSSGGATNTFTANLPPGTYRVTVLGALGETLTGNVSDPFVIGVEPVAVTVTPTATAAE